MAVFKIHAFRLRSSSAWMLVVASFLSAVVPVRAAVSEHTYRTRRHHSRSASPAAKKSSSHPVAARPAAARTSKKSRRPRTYTAKSSRYPVKPSRNTRRVAARNSHSTPPRAVAHAVAYVTPHAALHPQSRTAIADHATPVLIEPIHPQSYSAADSPLPYYRHYAPPAYTSPATQSDIDAGHSASPSATAQIDSDSDENLDSAQSIIDADIANTELDAAPEPAPERFTAGMPAPLYGSHEILLHQNQMADFEGLERIANDAQLNRLRRAGKLVPLPVSFHLAVDPRLPGNRRFCRPWTAKFLSQISAGFYARFGQPLQVNSAVRTITVQRHLERINGNAAPAAGDTASPHLTGIAVDISKHNMTNAQIAWMREHLLAIENSGTIDVEEEFRQAVFHISVYESYAPAKRTTRRHLASDDQSSTGDDGGGN